MRVEPKNYLSFFSFLNATVGFLIYSRSFESLQILVIFPGVLKKIFSTGPPNTVTKKTLRRSSNLIDWMEVRFTNLSSPNLI